ncbi:hypothetical protein ACF06P_28540 [Streptomyces sp. NPDC015684]
MTDRTVQATRLLLPVLAYGLLQKTAANRIVTRLRPAPTAAGT